MSLAGRALGVAAGLLLDRALGEPPDAWHPVAWFGTAMGRVERALYADARLPGAGYALVGAGLGVGSGLVLQGAGRLLDGGRRAGGGGAGATAAVATAVAVACAGRLLRHTSRRIEDRLHAGDLEGARELLPWLVGRDPSGLDESGVAAAVVESLAENTVDAVVAPVFWGLVAGAPGVLVHRAVNTMDAMVGHRSERYARFGTAAARLDDAMAWVPARVFALVVAAACSAEHRSVGRGLAVLRVVRRDAPAHPSPNAGVAESAAAAALGVELGGPLRYGSRLEERPRLGDGPRPTAATIAEARGLVDRVEKILVVGALAIAWAGSNQPDALGGVGGWLTSHGIRSRVGR
ncbi:CobD/CbiB family cobalamin biosynthesis protein [Ornithinimicrobium tianjinense]|uniref:CobD/CbiB family cobalamin biosynthesis protein n=1 Tax=Ornithinimicrobium tianjinense TaxID=1195761 RepID=UPI00166DE5FC|nr:CobD/CbiB family cobalamin biosynthesis protein [Ornithinimicrobium tianjinense]